ncbi:unnamed protein product [Danaus chrysippus]|uniref:(African queen) hypothetical protein n=1 Tax=Danaus chrysippus TaxID=151541 RepID=A0A8J2QW99_9NEOP|nr:unnamed protein product [Danaus chrysippus]
MPHPSQSESVFVLCRGLLEPCLVYCAVNRSYMSSSPRLFYITRVHLLSASVRAGSSLVNMQRPPVIIVTPIHIYLIILPSYLPPPPPSDVISFSRGASSVQELRRVQELGDRSSPVTRGDDDLQEPADPAKYKFGHSVIDLEGADLGAGDERSRGQELVMIEEERGRQMYRPWSTGLRGEEGGGGMSHTRSTSGGEGGAQDTEHIINGSVHSYRQWPTIDQINRLKRTLVCQNIVQDSSEDDVPVSTTNNITSDSNGPTCIYEMNDKDYKDVLVSGNFQHKQPKRSRNRQRYPETQSFQKYDESSPLIFILRPVLG